MFAVTRRHDKRGDRCAGRLHRRVRVAVVDGVQAMLVGVDRNVDRMDFNALGHDRAGGRHGETFDQLILGEQRLRLLRFLTHRVFPRLWL